MIFFEKYLTQTEILEFFFALKMFNKLSIGAFVEVLRILRLAR